MRPYPSRHPSQAGASLSTLSMMPPAEARCELPRIPIPRTPVNKASNTVSVEYLEPTRGRQKLARKGASADERASPKGREQKHPPVGPRALLQQRDYVGGPRLPRRGGHLLRAQGQRQRHSSLHLRADRRSEDRRGRRGRRLNRVAGGSDFRAFRLDELRRIPKRRSSQNSPSTHFGE